MLLVSIDKRRIDNIIIINNELLFSDTDEEDEVFYTAKPVNEYVPAPDNDYYHLVQSYLYDECYLDFNNEGALESFKDECLKQFKEGNYSFNYKDLTVSLEEIEDIPIVKKD